MCLEEAVGKLTFRVASIFWFERSWFACVPASPRTSRSSIGDCQYIRTGVRSGFAGNETRMIQRAAGVPHTIVNGELVIENGAVTGAFPRKVLRRKAREN